MAVTKGYTAPALIMMTHLKSTLFKIVGLIALCCCLHATAVVLPEDRSDVMYHSYDGGGITIDGPSVLVRKSIGSSVSVSANYYVDTISSASIDVQTYASEASKYEEERTENSFGVDYLFEKTILSLGYTSSDENDYEAETYFFGITQDFFGDLTTLTLSFAYGDNTVGKSNDPFFVEQEAERKNYRLGISQILTPSMILSFNYEAITDEGYLNNPYRRYRYFNPFDGRGFTFEEEVYPRTHTSDAAALGFKYYLPYRATVGLNYRYFTDDWDIDAKTLTLEYTHPIGEHWILDFTYREYEQTDAYFYSDYHQFQSVDEKDFRGRDKELSDFATTTYGIAISYEYKFGTGRWIEKGAISLNYDRIEFEYNNFTDLRVIDVAPGSEPLYDFEADVIRFFISLWY